MADFYQIRLPLSKVQISTAWLNSSDGDNDNMYNDDDDDNGLYLTGIDFLSFIYHKHDHDMNNDNDDEDGLYCLVLVPEAVGHHFPRQLLTEEGRGQQGIKDTTEVDDKIQ